VSLAEQSWSFLATILIGAGAAFIYDFYAAARTSLRLRRWGTGIGDVFFWLILIPFVFGLLLPANWGEVRWYVFLGLLLGAGLYRRTLSKAAFSFWMIVFKAAGRFCYLVTRPCAYFWWSVTWPVHKTVARMRRQPVPPPPDSEPPE